MFVQAVVACLLLASCPDQPTVYRDTSGVHLAGRIDKASATALRTELQDYDLLILDSDGGSLGAAIEIVADVTIHHVSTRVERDCASACALVFGAGLHRTVSTGARIGVHEASQAIGDGIQAEMLRMAGAPLSVISGMFSTPPQLVYWLNSHEITAWIR